MDNEEVTLLVMLDLSAAFDTIDHNILIDILKKDFGIVDNALQWFRSYLANKRQLVVIDRCEFSEFTVATRVPQGWLLFCLCCRYLASQRWFLNVYLVIVPCR